MHALPVFIAIRFFKYQSSERIRTDLLPASVLDKSHILCLE